MFSRSADSILQSILDADETAFEDSWELHLEYVSGAIDFSDPAEAKAYDDAVDDIECRTQQAQLMRNVLAPHIREYEDHLFTINV